MASSSLTGLDAAWFDATSPPPLVLANGEDRHETLEAVRKAGPDPEHLGTYRGFAWYDLVDVPGILCVAGVGPSNVELAVRDAHAAGLRTVIRLGTCGGVNPMLKTGHVVVAEHGVAFHDGVASVGADADEVRTPGDRDTFDLLVRAMTMLNVRGRSGTVVGTPFFHDPPASARGDRYRAMLAAREVDAVDMETGTLFWLGARLGAATGSVVGVANPVGDTDLDGPAALAGAARVVVGYLATPR